jgi:hypothetical protein
MIHANPKYPTATGVLFWRHLLRLIHPSRCVTKCNNRIKLEHFGLQRRFDQLRRFPEINIQYAPLLTMRLSTEFMSSIFSQITQILAEYKNKPKEQS